MNKQRRTELDRAHTLLIEAQDIINGVRSDEEDARENMPENLYYSERAEQMEEYCHTLEEAENTIDDLLSNLMEIIEG